MVRGRAKTCNSKLVLISRFPRSLIPISRLIFYLTPLAESICLYKPSFTISNMVDGCSRSSLFFSYVQADFDQIWSN